MKCFLAFFLLMGAAACKKNGSSPSNGNNNNNNSNPPPHVDSTYNPVDPQLPATIGFFGDRWSPRTFAAPPDKPVQVSTSLQVSDSLVIDVDRVVEKVPPSTFGNNSNLWMGQVVTQTNLMQYLKDLSPNIIRGPAGSISDVYFWNGTSVSPKPADAPDSVYTNGSLGPIGSWYGGDAANWTFSLSNYYNLLSQTNSAGIFTVNYGYARYGTGTSPVDSAAHLAANMVRADNGHIKYWEIGNECYGSWEAGFQIDPGKNKDGQSAIVTGALYGKHFQVFADSMRAAAQSTGAQIYIGAILYGSPPQSWDNATVQTWNQGVLSNAGSAADFFIVHDYFTAYNANSTAPQILATGISEPPTVMSYLKQQLQSAGVATKPIAMTEWNIQAVGSKQNTSFIAGMHAVLTLGSYMKNQYGEASRWDLANGYANGDDQGMFNIGDETGAPLWNPRPAFYYMYYFQRMFGDRMVFDSLKHADPDITTYSSTFSSGQAGTIITNTGSTLHVVSIDFQHFPAGSKYRWFILTGGTDNAPFSSQVYVNSAGPSTASGGPLNYAALSANSSVLNGTIKIAVPPMSVIYLVADGK